jgi:hypothetical protein
MGQPSPTGRQKMSPLAVLITAVLSLALSGALVYLCLKLLQAAVG